MTLQGRPDSGRHPVLANLSFVLMALSQAVGMYYVYLSTLDPADSQFVPILLSFALGILFGIGWFLTELDQD